MQPTNGREARRQRMPRPAEVVGLIESSRAGPVQLRYCFSGESKIGMQEEWESNAFLSVGRMPLATVSSGMRPGAGIGRIWTSGKVRQITTGSNGQLLSTGRRGDDVSKALCCVCIG